jgi:excisionase family DNA binding protein
MERAILTVREMAGQMGISLPTAYGLANRKDFPSIRVGKKILIPVQAFQAWLMSACNASTENTSRR